MKKVVLITGASSGVGRATAKSLNKEGYTVYAAARRIEKMKEDLSEEGITVLYLDLTVDTTITNCIKSVLEKEGKIDILINNSGRADFGTMEESSIEIAKAQYEVNVFGLARISQLVLPSMRKNGSGKIVNISSIGGKIVTPLGGWYQSTKFAVEAISDATRMEVKQFGIDVIIIEPGAIKTPIASDLGESVRTISGNGAYKKFALKVADSLDNIFENASSPELIAKTILEAIEAKKPKIRYSAGKKSNTYLLAKKLLSDKFFEKMLMREFI